MADSSLGLTPEQIVAHTKRLAMLHKETTWEWERRFCQESGLPFTVSPNHVYEQPVIWGRLRLPDNGSWE